MSLDCPNGCKADAVAVIQCRRCHAVLGVSTGAALTIGGAVFVEPVRPSCGRCGAVRKWRPVVH